jgi:hypothetical protein
MTSITITFSNSNDQPVFLQVDPWAGLYRLRKGDQVQIVAESETDSPGFQIDECGG